MTQFVVGIPATALNLVQNGLLERAFHDALVPAFQFRAEATWEEWPANSGTEILMTRKGLLAPTPEPLKPGEDPMPQNMSFEQWVAKLQRYGSAIDTHIPTSVVSNADAFLANIQGLGIAAGQTMNRLPRNALFKTYLAGHTVLIQATASTDTTIRVAALNGFSDVLVRGSDVRPSPISSTHPLAITVGGVAKNAIGFAPDNSDDPDGPGTLQLSTTVGSIIPVRSAVLSSARSTILRSGGGSSVDAITSSDTFVMQDIINSVGRLRSRSVLPHADGFYHCHVNNDAWSQIAIDPAFQRLNQGRIDSPYFVDAYQGSLFGCAFFLNNESPTDQNSGALTATGSSSFYSKDIGAETVNASGVRIGRTLITGRGVLRERGLDEKKFITEAGVNGKIGDFQVVNNGVSISTERVRLVLRAPIDRLQDIVSAAWDCSTSFSCPSDAASGSPERYKRAILIESVLDS